jgi:hypothetical protein
MKSFDYQTPRQKGEVSRAEQLEKLAHPGGPVWDVVTPVVCFLLGLVLYIMAYQQAWARLGGAAVIATSVAVAVKLVIEIAVLVGAVFMLAKWMEIYLGEAVIAAVKLASAVVLCDALATWGARLNPVPDMHQGSYVDTVAFISFFGFTGICFVLFRMNKDSYQGGPTMGVVFFAINLIVLIYFTWLFQDIGAWAASVAHLHIAANQVPFERPHAFWIR